MCVSRRSYAGDSRFEDMSTLLSCFSELKLTVPNYDGIFALRPGEGNPATVIIQTAYFISRTLERENGRNRSTAGQSPQLGSTILSKWNLCHSAFTVIAPGVSVWAVASSTPKSSERSSL